MKSKTTLSLGQTVLLNIPETIEEVEHMLGKNWMEEAAMCFHYRQTLPSFRAKYISNLEQQTKKERQNFETDAEFVKRVTKK